MGQTWNRSSIALRTLAASQGGFVSVEKLREHGVGKGERRSHLAAGRWVGSTRRGVVILDVADVEVRRRHLHLAEVGPEAAFGGITALQFAGLTGYDEPLPHIWVPKSRGKLKPTGVVLHETRRWASGDVVTVDGLRRSKPPVAALQGALWAKTLRQATLVVTMAVQQRICSTEEIALELDRVTRHRFRKGLALVLNDIACGSESLNEIDFLRLCREHGLPEPSRQARRRTPSGQVVTDAYWVDYGVVVEVQGAGHLVLDVAMSDEIRMLEIAQTGETMIPVSVLTLRTAPGPFFAALEQLLRSRGWSPSHLPAASA